MPSTFPPSAVPDLTDDTFEQIRRVVDRESGIHLSPAKKALVTGRLMPRLRALGLPDFPQYVKLALRDDGERARMIDRITTNETSFFREPWQFDFLVGTAIPRWRNEQRAGLRPRRVRVWSAGCSTGEEPFSVAMTLLSELEPEGWQIEILATDISHRVLESAAAATWRDRRRDEIPTELLHRFMLRGVGSQVGHIRAKDELRRVIRFGWANLTGETFPTIGTFDLVLCRNVLIYFARDTKVKVVERLADHVSVGGYLFSGHAESLQGLSPRVRTLAPTIHLRTDQERG